MYCLITDKNLQLNIQLNVSHDLKTNPIMAGYAEGYFDQCGIASYLNQSKILDAQFLSISEYKTVDCIT